MGTLGHWVTGTPSASAKKVSGTKIVEQKLVGTLRPLGDRDPKCKCKKVSRTKIAEQKIVEQKIAEQK